jgi:hypothetical protein
MVFDRGHLSVLKVLEDSRVDISRQTIGIVWNGDTWGPSVCVQDTENLFNI